MKNLSILIKPASSLCNMRCRYCFYADVSQLRTEASSGIMTAEVRSKLLQHTLPWLEKGDALTFCFQGGEPTMAGLSWFRDFFTEAEGLCPDGVRLSYAFQTNGLRLNEEWLQFFRQHNVLVGLSLDGPKDTHNQNRPDAAGKDTFAAVYDVKKRMDELQISYNVLSVLTNQTARHPRKFWNFLREASIDYIQLIPCLGPLEGGSSVYALTPERYADFYITFFDLWYQEIRRGRYISVKLFDDLLNLLAFGQPTACGINGVCQRQIVVEADGSVYPCDFYALDQWRVGNFCTDSLKALYEAEKQGAFVTRPRSLPPLCNDCPYRTFCGGGCPRMCQEVFCSPKTGFCGHRAFLDAAMPRLLELARQARP